MSKPNPIVVTVKGCARCSGEHERLAFVRLGEPIDDMTHWAACPNTGEPILLKTVEDDPAIPLDPPHAVG